MPKTKLHWILTILTLLVIGLIAAVPWVKANELPLTAAIHIPPSSLMVTPEVLDELALKLSERGVELRVMIVPSPFLRRDVEGNLKGSICERRMESAMRAVEPYVRGDLHTNSIELVPYSQAKQQWNSAKAECWKK